jgi:MoaA/NifB/PqqE/SkfB family radical SAM enzyme
VKVLVNQMFGSQMPARLLPPVNLLVQDELRRKLARRQRADHYYFVDVVGTCNLRCPSCPVGNWESPMPKGIMELPHFQEIVQTIRSRHDPAQRLFVDLYNWGEATLHPRLADIIKDVKQNGMGCGISTNMNVFPAMRDVVKAAPDYIRISLSGFYDETYRQTHARGSAFAVKANMYRLRELLDRHGNKETVVQVGYHIYRTNFPHDFLKMRELCDELGFLFDPVLASFMPAEKAAENIDGHIAPADQALHDILVVPMRRIAEIYRNDGITVDDCHYRKSRTSINFDGSVSLCCAVYDRDKIIADDFLAVDAEDLRRRKYSHDFCGTCMKRNLHLLYTAVPSVGLEQEAERVLGPLYSEFLEENRKIGSFDYVIFDNAFLSKDEAYQRGMDALRAGGKKLDEAEAYFDALVSYTPEFGEGFFQAARIAEKKGAMTRARALMAEAARLAPDHDLYRKEFIRLTS